jgi:hypothetical protein
LELAWERLMPGGPNALADKLRDELDDLGAELEVATSKAERSRINKRMHLLKGLLEWCVTRAGYI